MARATPTLTQRVARMSEKGYVSFDIIVHPSRSASKIIINCPGYNGHIDGYNGKYRALGAHLSKIGVGAFVQMPNITRPDHEYRYSLIEDICAVIERSTELAGAVCAGRADIYLMGFSAGASGVAGAASRYAQVKRILLMAPSGDAARERVAQGMRDFKGEVYIAIGTNDDVVGAHAGRVYYDMARSASKRTLVEIPDCDHQFRGRVNGQILSKAPLWAFAGDETFPSPDGGLVLYE